MAESRRANRPGVRRFEDVQGAETRRCCFRRRASSQGVGSRNVDRVASGGVDDRFASGSGMSAGLIVAEILGFLLCVRASQGLARLWRGDPRTVERFERRFREGTTFHRRWMTSLAPATPGAVFLLLALPANSLLSGTLATVVFVVLVSLGAGALLLSYSIFVFGRPRKLIPPVVRSWSV